MERTIWQHPLGNDTEELRPHVQLSFIKVSVESLRTFHPRVKLQATCIGVGGGPEVRQKARLLCHLQRSYSTSSEEHVLRSKGGSAAQSTQPRAARQAATRQQCWWEASSIQWTVGLQPLPKVNFPLQDRYSLQPEEVSACGFFRCPFVPVCVRKSILEEP